MSTDQIYSGNTKLEFCDRLGPDWTRLASYLGIEDSDRRSFKPGDEAREIWDWLYRRRNVGTLPEALQYIGRSDLARVLEPEPAAPVPSSSGWQGSPYPGLLSFKPEEAPIFFGRGSETRELLDRLIQPENRFIAVVGASGSGKSSLVRAGLIPKLQQDEWAWLRFTPAELSDDPFLAFASALKSLLSKSDDSARVIRERIRETPEMAAFASEVLAHRPNACLLVFIDQFEELFTVVAEHHRLPFAILLKRMTEVPNLRTVVTLRADFYHHCLAYAPLTELLRRSQASFPLDQPATLALWEMITGPAAVAKLSFEEGLAARVLSDTGDDSGALPLLAFALHELYERRTDGQLRHADYEAIGGIQGSIAKRAQREFDALPPAVQQRLEAVFRELVEVDEAGTATRRRAAYANLAADTASAKLLGAFTEARLLVTDRDAHGATVEVAHEALFRVWPKLADWIEATADDHRLRRQIEQQAKDWDRHGRSDERRWPDVRVPEAVRMLANLRLPPASLDPLIQDFLGPLDPAAMLEEIQANATPHARRALIGVRLALLGDPRPGVGLTTHGLPHIVWVDVPAGEVTIEIRSDPNDSNSAVADTLTRSVSPFRMARYPVTVAQFQAFLDDCWHDGGWRLPSASPFDLPDSYPPPKPRARHANHPVDSVNWWDAVTFCHWLTVRLQATGLISKSEVIRLPTEFEWQLAATGGRADARYPWGEEWVDPVAEHWRANTYESDLGGSTAVGLYPAGATPGGIHDLAGTLWEWCLNPFEDPDTPDVAAGNARRVVRGGSWLSNRDFARAAYRSGDPPVSRYDNLGLRVVSCSPIA